MFDPVHIRRSVRYAVLGIALGSTAALAQGDKAGTAPMHARAKLAELEGSGVSGQVDFRRAGEFVYIEGTVRGLAKGKHGIHVHEGSSCDNRGGHYNPESAAHGSPDQPRKLRHVGDLGNLVAADDGTAQYARVERLARLHGPHAVVGHVLVVHEGEDDYMSQPAGNSGKQIACGVIQRVSK